MCRFKMLSYPTTLALQDSKVDAGKVILFKMNVFARNIKNTLMQI